MAVDLGLDSELAAIKALPANSTQWTGKVAALLRRIFHSSANPFEGNARLDQPAAGSGFPIGGIAAFASGGTSGITQLARGFVRCGGQSLSRTDYAALFKVCGTRYGTANSASFNVPDIRRRQIIGRDTDFPVGTLAGTETTILSVNQLPTHRHGTSSMTVNTRPDHSHNLGYIYGKNEFPALEAGTVAVISPCPELHAVPQGTQGWPYIEGTPHDFPAARSGTGTPQQSGMDGAHGHTLLGRVTNVEGEGEEFSIMGPSIVLEFGIYTGIT